MQQRLPITLSLIVFVTGGAIESATGPAFASDRAVERTRIQAVTQPTSDFSKPERFELRPGGATTVFKALNRDSFSHPSANMAFARELDFRVGNGIFRKLWVS